MKNKLFLLSIMLVFLSSISYSQDRTTVAVDIFSSNKPTKYARTITDKVIEGMMSSGNFSVLNRSAMERIFKEQNIQADERFIDSDFIIEQGKMLGAKYIVNGNIDVLQITRVVGNSIGYRCTLGLSVEIIDAETGVSIARESFSASMGKANSREYAIYKAVEKSEKKLKKYFKKILL